MLRQWYMTMATLGLVWSACGHAASISNQFTMTSQMCTFGWSWWIDCLCLLQDHSLVLSPLPEWDNPVGTETGMFWDNYINTIADDLAPCIARSSLTTVLFMLDKQVLAFHEEGFQLPVPLQCWEAMENAEMLYVSKIDLAGWGLRSL